MKLDMFLLIMKRYPLGGIVSAIENSFQATPEVICSKDAVEEIRLCFYKDFKVRFGPLASSQFAPFGYELCTTHVLHG